MSLPLSPNAPAPLQVPGEYHLVEAGELCPTRGPVSPQVARLNEAFRGKILDAAFSCVAAKASMNTSAYAFAAYGELGSDEATRGLAHDLRQFVKDQDELRSDFTSLIATFETPVQMSEEVFEDRLWQQLRALHQLDSMPYSDEVSPDPRDPKFGFSFAGRGFFVIGLHPGSSRIARAFPVPALVFNAHRQFRSLRETGRFERMQQTIRNREVALQGCLNPNLANHGDAPEARQYSGRAVERDWVAPFPASVAGSTCPFAHTTTGE